jgi:hypothetical protein
MLVDSLGTVQEINVHQLTKEAGLVPGAFFSLGWDLNRFVYTGKDPEDAVLYGVQSYNIYPDPSISYISVFHADVLLEFDPPRFSRDFKGKRCIQFIPDEYIVNIPIVAFFESVKNGQTFRTGYVNPAVDINPGLWYKVTHLRDFYPNLFPARAQAEPTIKEKRRKPKSPEKKLLERLKKWNVEPGTYWSLYGQVVQYDLKEAYDATKNYVYAVLEILKDPKKGVIIKMVKEKDVARFGSIEKVPDDLVVEVKAYRFVDSGASSARSFLESRLSEP